MFFRAINLEDGLGFSITREEFSKFIISDIAIKMTDKYNMNITNIDSRMVSLELEDKSINNSERTWIKVTDEFIEAMNR